jgi:Delta3-Delta2-enoyl-CoA isomerase
MVNAFIRFPKMMVAIVNGPAIGIAGTVIALCDIVYASEQAYFYTPFTNLGLCAEGCSSVTFPRILGTSKANEMLMLNHRMTAREAERYGFVAHVYKDVREVWERLKQIKNLPIGSIMANKNLTRKFTIQELEAASMAEAEELGRRFESEEFFAALMSFQEAKKKAKSKL